MIHKFRSLFASRSVQILVEISGFLQASRMEISGCFAGLWALLFAGLLAVFVQMLRIMKSMHKEMRSMDTSLMQGAQQRGGCGTGELAQTTLQTMKLMAQTAKTYYATDHGERVHWRRGCPGLNAARHVRELKGCDICCPV